MRTTKALTLALAAASAVSCTTGKFEPRIVGVSPPSTPSAALADAKRHFALGNYALALEEFKRALRYAPDEVDAYNGIAACYDQMGRFDLSRRYYEEALAVAPEDPKVLHNLRLSMTMQGRTEALAAKSSPAPSRAPIELGQQPVDLAAAAVAPAHGVTIELPRVADLTAPVAPQVKTAAAKPVTVKAPPAVRLERLSLAEVGLVTGPAARHAHAAPKLQPKMVLVKSSPHELEWRLTSIENAPQAVRTAELQVLNAVGRRGIAARMTGYLAARGWSAVRPADAPRSRMVSTIVYPATARLAANRLAARLPFPTQLQPAANGAGLVLLVGSNALSFDDRLRRTKTS